jgi:hypothetical protein
VRLAFAIMVTFAVLLFVIAVTLMHRGVGIRE